MIGPPHTDEGPQNKQDTGRHSNGPRGRGGDARGEEEKSQAGGAPQGKGQGGSSHILLRSGGGERKNNKDAGTQGGATHTLERTPKSSWQIAVPPTGGGGCWCKEFAWLKMKELESKGRDFRDNKLPNY